MSKEGKQQPKREGEQRRKEKEKGKVKAKKGKCTNRSHALPACFVL
jgi:hypothetical protein